MKKLLFLTSELPYPGNSGGKLKSLQLLERLMDEYRVSLACPLKLDDRLHATRFLAEHRSLHKVMMRATDVARTPANLLRSYAQGVPLNVLRTANGALAAEIAAVIDEFDVVFIDHYEAAQYVPESYQGLRVYHAHNAYHKLWQRYAEQGGNPAYRIAAAIECRRVRKAEVALCDQSDLVFAAPNDIDALVSAGAEREHMRETYHLGDDANLAQPALRRAATGRRLLYVGNLAWEPNCVGLHWFLERIWPQLKQAHPDIKLDIAGRGADAKLCQLAAEDEGIALHGFVENLEPLYRKARISVAPLTFGAGMKVKVLSAMARGLPVVTTEVGAEGISASHGQHMMINNDPEAMTADILRLLSDAVLWQRLATESRELVARQYTWQGLFQNMMTAMRRMEYQQVMQRLPLHNGEIVGPRLMGALS